MASQTSMDFSTYGMQSPTRYQRDSGSIEAITNNQILTSNGTDDRGEVRLPNGSEAQVNINSASQAVDNEDAESLQDNGNGLKSRNSLPSGNPNQIEAEWIEQYEPGVYITLMALRDGTRDLKRVRFR